MKQILQWIRTRSTEKGMGQAGKRKRILGRTTLAAAGAAPFASRHKAALSGGQQNRKRMWKILRKCVRQKRKVLLLQ